MAPAGSAARSGALCEPSRDRRQRLGERGEAAAVVALERAGLTILDRRYRRRIGEIDIVARLGSLLVFVEVKTRAGTGYGAPAAAVTPGKRRRMARVALDYMARRGWLERPVRFDVVEVEVRNGRIVGIRHIVDAFRLWPTG